MQTLNTIRLKDRLLFAEDVASAVQVVDELPAACKENVGLVVFLGRAIGKTDEWGLFYRCAMYYVVDPITGLKHEAYRWVRFDSNSTRKLGEFTTPLTVIRTIQADNCVTVRLNWAEPEDIAAVSGVSNSSAYWLYSVVVRKRGTEVPTSTRDGEIVGYSSTRDQYKTGTGFVDIFSGADADRYSYNVFAITTTGVESPAVEPGGSAELTWKEIRDRVDAGRGGEIFAIGDIVTVNHATYGELELQVVAFDNAVLESSTLKSHPHTVTLMSRHVIDRVPYDAKELAVAWDGSSNPGDYATNPSKWCSARGCASWDLSNLHAWLGGAVPDDRKTDTLTKWHTTPNASKNDAVYPTRATFASGFDPDFYSVLLSTHSQFIEYRFSVDSTGTVKGECSLQHGYGKIFIPSYRELFGTEPRGLRNKVDPASRSVMMEGTQFSYFNKDIEIPELPDIRSVVKRDRSGVMSGYFTRTFETEYDHTTGGYRPTNMSGLYVVGPKGSIEEAPIDIDPVSITSCRGAHMTASEAALDSTPGFVFCVVI